MENQERELAKKEKNAAKRQKVIMLEVKFKSNVHGVREERVGYGCVDTPFKSLDAAGGTQWRQT